ncbi:MAG: hypothetical protein GY835_20175 [bacterium]|nr:hypothetical protein [bacterium]
MKVRYIRTLCLATLLVSTPFNASGEEGERETSYVYPPFKHTLGMNRVGTLELKLFLGPGTSFRNPQGVTAVKMRDRDDPKTERDDDELTLFMVNSGAGQIFYNPSLYSVSKYGGRGSGEGEFLDPRGIGADRDGNVVIADTGNQRLVMLRLGDDLRWVGEIKDANGPFTPTDVVLADGLIWVTDYSGNRIIRFDMSGAFLGEWPLELTAGLAGPLALTVMSEDDPWNPLHRFTMVVVDSGGERVRTINGKRREVAIKLADEVFPSPGLFGYPVVDLHGQILLPDSLGGRIAKLGRNLTPLTVFDHVDDDTPLRSPNSLAIYRRFGQLFILENNGGCYAWTGTDITDARIVDKRTGRRHNLKLEITLTEPSFLTVSLIEPGAADLALILEKRFRAGTRQEWLRLPREPVPGATIRIEATPTYSARKKLTVVRVLDDLLPKAAAEIDSVIPPAATGEKGLSDQFSGEPASPALPDSGRSTAAEDNLPGVWIDIAQPDGESVDDDGETTFPGETTTP